MSDIDNEYYAKSKNGKYSETLLSHLSKTLDNTEDLIKKYKIASTELQKAIKIASAFHDIGKADYRFQKYLISNESRPTVFHPLLGLSVIDEIASSFSENIKSLIILAVASHHTNLHQDLYSRVEDDSTQTLTVKNRSYFEKIVYKLASRIGIDSVDIVDCYQKSCMLVLRQAKYNFLPSSVDDGISLRECLVNIQGILNYSDWLASGQNNIPQLNLDENFISNPYDYQITAKNTIGNVFITLPTGSGKTETALFWIIGNLSTNSKVFYTLPTTTTINAMYQRFTDKTKYGLSQENVSEYFSNVDLYLKLEGGNPKTSSLYLYKNFFYPLNITTPDQLILAMMNHGRYSLKSFLMKKSLIIFDEIHAYDSETFGLIKSLIKHIHQYSDSKFCIMSATFPAVLKKELSFLDAKELIGKDSLETEYRRRRRTHIEFAESYISQNLDRVISYYRNGMKILIVMNTVGRAQETFMKLRDLMQENDYTIGDLMLIHSRFTFKDKRNLEKKIFKYPKIVVATQVIEVSLDIDYDILFTEVCYPDSLVQRAGRINRSGKLGNNGEGLVCLFLPEDWLLNDKVASLPYDYLMLRDSIQLLREEASNINSELDYIRITNKFYEQSWQSSQDAEERFEEIWKQVRYIYRANLSEEGMINLLRTRSGVLTINSYSRTHWDAILNLDRTLNKTDNVEQKFDLQRQIRMFSINVPIISSCRGGLSFRSWIIN